MVPMPEFDDVKNLVDKLLDPIINAATWSASLFGLAAGGVLSWLTMDKPDSTRGVIVVVASAAAFILAIFMAFVSWMIRRRYDEPSGTTR